MKFFTAERPKDAALRRPSPEGNKESGKATFPCEERSLRSCRRARACPGRRHLDAGLQTRLARYPRGTGGYGVVQHLQAVLHRHALRRLARLSMNELRIQRHAP